jgi:hypothetical protein
MLGMTARAALVPALAPAGSSAEDGGLAQRIQALDSGLDH